MKKVQMVKLTNKKGEHIYKVLDDDGKVIYQSSPTHRNYVAIYLTRYAPYNEVVVKNRFGRVDLIGKGDSKFMFDDPEAILAVLDAEPSEEKIEDAFMERLQTVIKGPYGKKYQMEIVESDASPGLIVLRIDYPSYISIPLNNSREVEIRDNGVTIRTDEVALTLWAKRHTTHCVVFGKKS